MAAKLNRLIKQWEFLEQQIHNHSKDPRFNKESLRDLRKWQQELDKEIEQLELAPKRSDRAAKPRNKYGDLKCPGGVCKPKVKKIARKPKLNDCDCDECDCKYECDGCPCC